MRDNIVNHIIVSGKVIKRLVTLVKIAPANIIAVEDIGIFK